MAEESGLNSVIKVDGDTTGAVAGLHAIDAGAEKVSKQVASMRAQLERTTDALTAQARSYDEVAIAEQKIGRKSIATSDVSTSLGGLRNAQSELDAVRAVKAENAHYEGLKNQWAAANQARIAREEANLRSYQNSIRTASLEMEAMGKTVSERAAIRGKLFGIPQAEIDKEVAGLRRMEQQLAKTNPRFNEMGLTAKGTAAALRNVPAQFTDIIVSLQGGQRPMTVLLQQGGQLKDMFGGVGNAVKAMGGYVIGLINPFTIAAAAVVGLGVAMASINSRDSALLALSTQLSGTGRASVAAVGDIRALVNELNQVTGVSKASAAAILGEFAKVSGLGGALFRGLGASVADFAAATGTDLPSAARKLAAAFADPAKGVKDLEAALGTLRAGQILTVEKMAALGDKSGAQIALMQALKTATQGLAEQGMTPLGQSTEKLSNAWDAMTTSVGSSDAFRSANNWLAVIIDKVATLAQASSKIDFTQALPVQFRVATKVATTLIGPDPSGSREASGKVTDAFGTSQGDVEKQVKAALAATTAYTSQAGELAKLKATAKQAKDALKELETQNRGTGIEAVTLRERISGINEKLAAMAKKGKGTAGQEAKAQLALDLEQIKRDADVLTSNYGNAEKIMQAQRAAGLVDERAYYASKTAFLNLNSQARDDALTKELARLQAEKLGGKDAIDNARKIAGAQAELAKLRENSVASLQVLGIQEAAAGKKMAQYYRDAEAAAQSYLDTLRKANATELSGMGKGNLERSRSSGRAQIEDKYTGQRQSIDKSRRDAEFAGTFGSEAQKKYDDELDRIRRFQATALGEYDSYFAQRLKKEGDWSVGASEALRNYYDESRNIAAQTESVFTNAFQNMEDAIIEFGRTGKLSFKDLAESIIFDLARIEIKRLTGNAIGSGGSGGDGWIASLVGMAAGAAGGTGAQAALASSMSGDSLENMLKLTNNFGTRAIGGPVSAGGMYRVNEQGPELLNVAGKQYLMMGSQGGSVTNNSATTGGNTTILNVNVTPPAGSSTSTAQQWGATAGRQIQRATARNT